MSLDESVALSCYEKMFLIRKFEEKAGQLYSMGKIGGFCHLYIGQEAVCVGVEHCIKNTDCVITSYRDHGVMLARGSDPFVVISELLGKKEGCSGGKGGSMHIFDLEKNFFGGHGIVGAQVPLGTGLGFATKYKKTDSISVVYMGDGAVSQGQVYESFNIAALWGLPILYIIENNMYGMGTSVKRAAANEDLYNRGESFGIPGIRVDGMNVNSVIEATASAVERIRSNSRPEIIEFKTYRFRGHSMSDPAGYRTKEELNDYKNNHDPIESLRSYVLKNEFMSLQEIKELEVRIKAKIKDSVESALASWFPDENMLYQNVYKSS